MRDERGRLDAVAGTSVEPLTPAERAELIRLRSQVAEQEKDLTFLGLCRNPDYVETVTRALCLTQI